MDTVQKLTIEDIKRAMHKLLQERNEMPDRFYYFMTPAEIDNWEWVCQFKSTYPNVIVVKQMLMRPMWLVPQCLLSYSRRRR